VSALLLGGFLLATLAGLAGTPVGNRNFATVMVWIVWWAVLIWIAIPLFGRGWCSVCPLPLPGEWIQRRSSLGPGAGKPLGLNLRWPRRLRTLWPSIGLFSVLAVFSVPILTRPLVTAAVLVLLALGAVAVSLIFERRTFCRFVCPIGGFVGLYAQAALVGLRVKDNSVCAVCADKPCYHGSSQGFGCPWLVFPGGLTKNVNCGLCLECLRTCPQDNLAIYLRPPGRDLAVPSHRWDEAFKALALLAASLAYAAVLFEPTGNLKAAANVPGTARWLVYSVGLVVFLYLLVPALFAGVVRASQFLSRSQAAFRTLFTASAGTLVPLGLMTWVAFCLGFIPANAGYAGMVLSDPFGWGWDLLGGAETVWNPSLAAPAGPLQAVVLAIGVFWTARVARRVFAGLRLTPIPVVAFSLGAVLSMQWLLG
jgi:polyferredoxin